MKTWIRVHAKSNGEVLLLNMQNIVSISEEKDGTRLYPIADESYFLVEESLEDISLLLVGEAEKRDV